MPPQPYESTPLDAKSTLSTDDKATYESWKQSYAQWQTEQKNYDQANVDLKNQFATSVSMLVVGLPVLYFHQRELRKKLS